MDGQAGARGGGGLHGQTQFPRLVFAGDPATPMLPALPVYDSPDCRGGGKCIAPHLCIGYGSPNHALRGHGVSAGGAFLVFQAQVQVLM